MSVTELREKVLGKLNCFVYKITNEEPNDKIYTTVRNNGGGVLTNSQICTRREMLHDGSETR